MKKYLTKKSIILIIALIYVFFAGFKFLKGKSFFDTIVEYTNNIHSINAEIVDATRDNYSLLNFEYIPIKYVDYKEASFGKYIVRKEDSNNLYIYEPVTKQERLFVEVEKKSDLHDVIVDENWVIWLESNEKIDNGGSEGIVWNIFAKMINGDNKILVEQGIINGKKTKEYMNFIPREFEIEANTLIYTKYSENTINKNNIITTTMMTSIVKYDLEAKESELIATSYNNYKEELSDVKMDSNNVIWQKKYKDIKTDETTKTEVYKYSIDSAKIEKIFETSNIYMIDIKGDNVAIVAKNPDDNILIYNLENKSFTNIFYKGSRIEKLLRTKENTPVIINLEFITNEKLFIGVSSKKSNISAVVYDLKLEEFLNYDNLIDSIEDVSLMQYGVNKNKLLTYVGIVDRNIDSEEDKDLYNETEDVEIKKNNEQENFVDIEGINVDIEGINVDIAQNDLDMNLDEAKDEISDEKDLYYKYFEYLLR